MGSEPYLRPYGSFRAAALAAVVDCSSAKSVVVPPKAWHQTYALEPSCAVASQFCGRPDAPTVIEHMLRHRSREDDGVLHLARTAPPRDAVRALFARLDSDS